MDNCIQKRRKQVVKKMVALFLTLAMLLSMVSTVSIAAPATTAATAGTVEVPEIQATIAGDGTVTVTCDAFKPSDEGSLSASIDYRTEDGTYRWATLEYDNGKFTGQFEDAVGATLTWVSVSQYQYKYDEEYTKEDSTSTSVTNNYDYETGKLFEASYRKSQRSEKLVEIEYKDQDGNTKKTNTWVTTKETAETKSKQWDNGVLWRESTEASTTAGDEKTRTVESTGSYSNYNSETGKVSQQGVNKSTRTQSSTPSEYGGLNWETTQETTDNDYNNYNNDGAQTSANKVVESTTYNAARDKRTTERTGNYSSYDTETGKVYQERAEKRTYSQSAKRNEEYGYTEWVFNQDTIENEYKNYDSETGEYTGKSVNTSDNVYSDGTVVKATETNANYNKDGYQTSSGKTVTDTEYNAAKDKRTVTTSGETAGYNDYGKLIVTGETSGKQEQAKGEYGWWETTSSSSSETKKNKNGAVIYSATSSSDDKGNSSSETKVYDQFGTASAMNPIPSGTRTASRSNTPILIITITKTVQTSRAANTQPRLNTRRMRQEISSH